MSLIPPVSFYSMLIRTNWERRVTNVCVSMYSDSTLRTVPAFVTAHTLCASRDNTTIFLRGLRLCGKSRS